ncbi:hypothetical protein FB451DRAFT_1250681 [Mycena latifolia]|nr:hypothetical protein FB451DRAFT_1250681 [Mycena latifolia]
MSYNETAILELINNQHFFNVNLGPFLTGLAAQMFMMGCLSLQMWKYFEDHGSDTLGTKTYVVVLFLASAFQCATDFQLLYDAFVTGYGRILYFNKYGWTFFYEPAWTALIAALAQLFFLQRCWTVTKSPWVVGAGGLGIAISLGAGIATSAGLVKVPYYTSTSQVIVQATTWLIATAVTDVGISIILVMHLRKMKTGFKKEKTLSRIVRVTFETAALTSVIAIVDLLLYITMGKHNTIHLAFQLIVGKTYNHSVMVTLLSRTKIRSDFDSNSAGRIGNTDSNGTKPAAGITVTRTQIRITDHLEYPMKSIVPSERGEEEDLDTDTNSTKIQRMV